MSRIRKKTFYLQFSMDTPEGHQKSIFNTSKVKKMEIHNGIYPTEFASSTQNPKKINGTPNLLIKTKIFPKKSMFSSLKVKRS
jgi:predicted GH43/DUF377 family glycosyl hydrolase